MKILADTQNIGFLWKYWRIPKILAGIQNIGVWQKYRRTIESWRALKSPRLAKISAEKFGGSLTIWAWRNPQLLTSSWTGWRALVQILIDVLPLRHVDPKWDHSSSRSAFMGGVSPVLYRLVVPAQHAKIYAGVQIIGSRAYFHQFLWKLKNSISAPKCPITEPKIRIWSLLLSRISYHSHSLQNGGHPRLLARLPKSVPSLMGERGGGSLSAL
jgi:hypothetical protein